ncbi:MAG: cobalamin B12-binding domain-containing protein [Eubacteriaceae bacterium]
MTKYSNLTKEIGELHDEKVLDIVNDFMNNKPTQEEANQLIKCAQEGMAIVGDRFEKGEYFVGDLIFGGELITEIIDIIKPLISGTSNKTMGKIVIGTVKGDLHDIGKNIFRLMSEAEGFEVYDIGIDQSVESFIEIIKETKPDILGMSGVLTLALNSMKNTVDAIKESGLKEDMKIIIGGNPVNKEACEHIGADAFTSNAVEGISICKEWMNI